MRNKTITTNSKSIFSVLFFSLFFLFTAKSQEKLGLQNSNFAGTHAIYLNPANISTPGNLVYVGLFNRGVSFNNNYLDYNAPFKLNKWANGKIPTQYQTPLGKADFRQSWLRELELNGASKSFNFHQDIRPITLMVPVGTSTFISFNSRQRTGVQIVGMDESFARIARYGIDNSKADVFGTNNDQLEYQKNYATEKGFKAHFESWQEYSFAMGHVYKKTKTHMASWGFNVKFLRGMGFAHISSKDIDLTVEGADSLTFNSGSFDYAHSSEESMLSPLLNPWGWADHETTGYGVGIDVGWNYMKIRSRTTFKQSGFWDWGCNYRKQYDWKIGAALMDLGVIQHNNGVKNFRADFSSPFGYAARSGMLNDFSNDFADGFNQVDADLIDNLPDTKINDAYTSYLPAALTVQADVRMGNRFYLGFNGQANLKSRTSNGLNASSFFSVIPRIEGYFAEFALPVTLSNSFAQDQVHVGFFARLWMVHFGSDNLGGLMGVASNNNFTGASIYGGFSIPIPYCRGRSYVETRIDKTLVKDDPEEEILEETPVEEVIPDTKSDTVFIERRDTVRVETTNPDFEKREQEFREREKELERRIKDLENRPTTTPTSCVDCERRLREERAENDRIRRELTLEREKVRTLERENDILRDRLRNIEVEKVKLEELLKTCENLRRTETPKVAELEKKIIDLETERIRCENIRVQCEKDKVEYIKRITNLEKELAECRAKTTTETPDEELKRLRDKIVLLEKEKKDLIDLRIKCDETNRELTIKVTVLEKELEKCRKDVDDMVKTIDQINQDRERIAVLLINTRDSLNQFKIKVTQLENDKKKCDEELKTLQAKVTLIETERNNCKTEVDKLKVRITELEKQTSQPADCKKEQDEIKNITLKLTNARDSVKLLQIKITELDNSKKKCETDMKAIVVELEKTKGTIEELEKRLENCEKGGDNSKELQELRARITSLENDKKKCDEESNAKDLTITNYKKDLDTKDKIIKSLRDSLMWIRSDLDYCNEQYKNTMNEYQSAMKKVNDLTKELNECKDKLKDCEKIPGSNSSENSSSLNTEIEELQKKLKTAEEKVKTLDKQLSDKQTQIDQLKNSETNLNKKLNDCESAASNSNTSSADQAKIKELEAKVATLETSLKNAESALTQSKNKEKELEAKIKTCEDEKSKLGQSQSGDAEVQKKIADLEKEKQSLQNQLNDIKAQSSEKEKEINSLKQEVNKQKIELNKAPGLQRVNDSLRNVNQNLQRELKECNDKPTEGQGNVIPGSNNRVPQGDQEPSGPIGSSGSVNPPSIPANRTRTTPPRTGTRTNNRTSGEGSSSGENPQTPAGGSSRGGRR